MEKNQLVMFAERVLALLDQGSFAATYKYAVLLALMDLCLEKTRRDGSAPDSVTTRQLAEKVIELYWPQTTEFDGRTLRQNSGEQARIVADICQFRAALEDPSVSVHRAQLLSAAGFERLVRKVEWTLILMPLPRLQVAGRKAERLLYQIGWDLGIARRSVSAYQAGRRGAFDNNIRLLPGVGDHLVALNTLLRPLVHRAWSGMVAQFNGLEESRLESFLFGADRTVLAPMRAPLLELQDGLCFYCRNTIRRGGDVDHFIPWKRCADNGIHNLVVADERCNGDKSAFLAADRHLARWRDRNSTYSSDLAATAATHKCESHPEETLGVARGIYLRLSEQAQLWCLGNQFCSADPSQLRRILA
jgi:hypothetical protein